MPTLFRRHSWLNTALTSFSLAGILAVGLRATDAAQRGQASGLFKGVTTNGNVVAGLFPIRSTGVTTAPVRAAAVRYLAALSDSQRARTTFKIDDNEWRSWTNVHRGNRLGVSFREMNEAQRSAAFDLMRASLSAKGLELSRNIMRLNETIAELTNNFTEYGEHLYYITVMGEPSDTQPWGWQLEGHHLIVNYFVLRDQVVMTPTFMGSEPVTATSGKYAGTSILQVEEKKGIVVMRALTEAQRQKALLQADKIANNAQSQAGQDNLVIDYAGIKASELNETQRALLLDLAAEYVSNMDSGHARVKMDEVRRHINDTYFAWIGGMTDTSVFYYRIHSPVVLIEFDHQTPVALRSGGRGPGRQHIHSVVRTPNGNDYGKDLLRQHLETHRNDATHGHTPNRR